MNETCDRCGPAVGAAYRVNRVGELYLCAHCASQQWRALSAQGWTFWPLGAHALAPQAGAAPDYGPLTMRRRSTSTGRSSTSTVQVTAATTEERSSRPNHPNGMTTSHPAAGEAWRQEFGRGGAPKPRSEDVGSQAQYQFGGP